MLVCGSRINLNFLFVFSLILLAWTGSEGFPSLSASDHVHMKKHPLSAIPAPFFMPQSHPIKHRLDSLFSSKRVTLNMETLQKAGFKKSKPRKFTKLIVTTHPKFPGYIFKLYLDAQRPHKNIPEHQFWVMRIEGAKKIRSYIAQHDLKGLFKVPKKWIYALPTHPLPPEGYYRRMSILVEEDMEILSNTENKQAWASDDVTHLLLHELYMMLKTLGLRDCAKPENIPFSRDGRIAFIDTQTHGSSTVHFSKLNHALSPENRTYWKSLSKD